jgi:hypothetical protein
MATIEISTAAVEYLRSWLADTSMENAIPYLCWATVDTPKGKHAEGWTIVLCPRDEKAGVPGVQNLAPIRNLNGIDVMVSELSFSKHPVSEMKVDLKNEQLCFNGHPCV